MGDRVRGPERWRQSAALIGLELAIFAGVYLADWSHHIYISKIPYLLALRGCH